MEEQAEVTLPQKEKPSMNKEGLDAALAKYGDQIRRMQTTIHMDRDFPLGEHVFSLGDWGGQKKEAAGKPGEEEAKKEVKEKYMYGIVNWGMGARVSEAAGAMMNAGGEVFILRMGGTMEHKRPVLNQEGVYSAKGITPSNNPEVTDNVLHNGDAVDIPANTPYQIIPVKPTDTVSYIMVRFPDVVTKGQPTSANEQPDSGEGKSTPDKEG